MRKRLSLLLSALLLCCSAAWAESTSVTVSSSTGTLYRYESSTSSTSSVGNWCHKWVSTTPISGVTISAADYVNNLEIDTSGNVLLANGKDYTSFTFTVSAPSGYVFTGLSANVTANTTSNIPTVVIDGTSYTTSSSSQSINQSIDSSSSFSIVINSSSKNGCAAFTNFVLTLEESEDTGTSESGTPYELSTDSEQHWYYIINKGTPTYSYGMVLIGSGSGEYLSFGSQSNSSDRIWSFWEGDDGKLAIKNYDGVYVGTAPSGTGNSTAVSGTSTANYIYTVTSYDDDYTIGDGNGEPLHAQEYNSRIVRWAAASNNASLWNFVEVDPDGTSTDATGTISSTSVVQGKVTTGIGNKDQGIIRSTIVTNGKTTLTQVKGKITATSLSDVSAVKAYLASNERELYVDDPDHSISWREPNGTLLGEGTIASDGTYTIDFENTTLASGTNYLWIALDISDDATEGNTVDASITSYTAGGTTRTESNGDPTYNATIFLTESAALMPMDNGTLYYRIPAITATADGKRLIALTDDRSTHDSDLPSHVYVMAQYSDDNGKTWSEPQCVAGTSTTGGDYGHGDAELITNRITGDIIGIMTSSPYGTGWSSSTISKPQAWKMMKSSDNGETWTVPVDYTSSLYANGSPNSNIEAGFSGSGSGLQKRDGTLVSPFVGRTTSDVQNYYSFISKDNGDSWELYGTSGTTSADEPKVLERNNGNLAISVRATGYNYYNWTTDDGLTWQNSAQTRFTSGITGNACNGEYMVWSSTLDGNEQNIAFQTLPYNSSRMNVSIALSTDEGASFFTTKTICPRGSAYSSAVVMDDGTLGVYYEENGVYGDFTMRFVRFSLDWASDGKYNFDNEPFHPVQSFFVDENADVENTNSYTAQYKYTATIKRSFSAGWASLVVPFDIARSDFPKLEKILTYTGTTSLADGNYTANFTEADTIPAHTPVLIKLSEAVENPIFLGVSIPTFATSAATTVTDPSGAYNFVGKYSYEDGETSVIQKGDYIVTTSGLAYANGGNKIKSTRAYLKNVSGETNEARSMTISIDDSTTSVDAIELTNYLNASTNGDAYDLMGRKVKDNQKGIVIVNGKKIVR